MAPSTCLERVRELQRARSDHGLPAPTSTRRPSGRPMEAILSIQQGSSQRQATENLLEHAAALPETVRVMALTGTTDFIIHVAVRDMDHLRDLSGA